MLKYIETPIIEISEELLANAGVRLFVKREDLNHPFVSGNKWWKLKYNLTEVLKQGHDCVLTFGGAFSNHIYATAGAANELGLKSIGVIRGEETLPLNATLDFAQKKGMKLHYVNRAEYRAKNNGEFVEALQKKFGKFFLIPEGGSNSLAVAGCAEFAREKLAQQEMDYVCLPVGTGGTMAGVVAGLRGTKSVIGFSVLKNGEFLNAEVARLITEISNERFSNWRVDTNYHFGGYGKNSPELDQLIARMNLNHQLPLEFVYTAKMVAGVFDLISKKYFDKGSRILLIHTGGLRIKFPQKQTHA